jgi:4'-phosphopantetheinyl transferase
VWSSPRGLPLLSDDAVHVWTVRLDIGPASIQHLAETLAVDELKRAAAFRFAHLRRRFVVTHAVVRLLLGHYVGAAPSSLRFSFGTFGKPSLVDRLRGEPLAFNISHSDELALIAVARGREVGVDVERLRPIEDVDAIAGHYFCAQERDVLQSRQGESKTAFFLAYWTRKEAVLKATGDGLSVPLDQVDVSTVPGDRPHVIAVADGAGALRQLALVDLKPASGYVGALAVEGTGWQLNCWSWPDQGDVDATHLA